MKKTTTFLAMVAAVIAFIGEANASITLYSGIGPADMGVTAQSMAYTDLGITITGSSVTINGPVSFVSQGPGTVSSGAALPLKGGNIALSGSITLSAAAAPRIYIASPPVQMSVQPGPSLTLAGSVPQNSPMGSVASSYTDSYLHDYYMPGHGPDDEGRKKRKWGKKKRKGFDGDDGHEDDEMEDGSPIPVPAPAVLLGSGLIALAMIRRKQAALN